MFPDVVLQLVHCVLIFPSEKGAKRDAVPDVLGTCSLWEFTQILFVLPDSFVIVAGHELGVAKQVTNLLAEVAFWLGIKDPAEVRFRRFWIAGLQRDRTQ